MTIVVFIGGLLVGFVFGWLAAVAGIKALNDP